MRKCNNCQKSVDDLLLFECSNCGASMCEKCADITMRICPYCYSSLDFKE